MRKTSSYKFRLTKPKLWDFKNICQSNKSSMQKELERMVDEYIEEQIRAGVVIPPCPYDDLEPEDIATFREVLSEFNEELVEAGFKKGTLMKMKAGTLVPSEREYKVISNVTGLTIDHLKGLP